MSKIEIKPSHKGKFTEYCKNKGHKGVTSECIEEGLASRGAATRKQAQFAENARSFNH
jgi:hypothetical protein